MFFLYYSNSDLLMCHLGVLDSVDGLSSAYFAFGRITDCLIFCVTCKCGYWWHHDFIWGFLDLCRSFSLVTPTIKTELADLLKASLNKQSRKFRL
jgi:hypothetical protein